MLQIAQQLKSPLSIILSYGVSLIWFCSILNYENEKFSYIILSKGDIKLSGVTEAERNAVREEEERTEDWGRLVRQPIKKGKHIVVDSCDSDGLLRRQICSKSLPKVLYKYVEG